MSKFAILLIGFFSVSVSVSYANVFDKYLGTYSVHSKPVVQGTSGFNCNSYPSEGLTTVSLDAGSKSDPAVQFSLLLTDARGKKSEILLNKEQESLAKTPEQSGSATYYFSKENSLTGLPYVAYVTGLSDLRKGQNFAVIIEETGEHEVRLTIINSSWSADSAVGGCNYSVELKKN